jgi:hypothetical protein
MFKLSANGNRNALLVGFYLWLLLLIGGFVAIEKYVFTSAVKVQPRVDWPRESTLTLSPNGNTLLFFAHPYCPCSQASLKELNRMLSNLNDARRPAVSIIFFKPGQDIAYWKRTPLWRLANRIPQARILFDIEGQEARRFHVTTSGQIAVYRNDGSLLYNGGITGERGHEGDNPAEDKLLSLLREPILPRAGSDKIPQKNASMPTFGCQLFDKTPISNTSSNLAIKPKS